MAGKTWAVRHTVEHHQDGDAPISQELIALLEDGWEPFAVIPAHHSSIRIYLRKQEKGKKK